MPQASDITLAVNAGSQTFKPKSVHPTAIFQDDTAATNAGRPEITCSHRLVTDKVGGRTRLRLTVPVEATIDGNTTVVRENTVFIDIVTAPDSLAQERENLMELSANLLQNLSILSVVKDGEQFR